MDVSVAAVIILLGLVALRGILIGVGIALILRPVRECPACFRETFGLHHRLLRFVAWLEWRWCPGCGWQGPARRLSPANERTTPVSQPRGSRAPGQRNRLSP